MYINTQAISIVLRVAFAIKDDWEEIAQGWYFYKMYSMREESAVNEIHLC